MAGPAENLKEGWGLIMSDPDSESGLVLDKPVAMNFCLGCHHKIEKSTMEGKPVRECRWVMSEFLNDSVEQYCALAKAAHADPKIKQVDTPLLILAQ